MLPYYYNKTKSNQVKETHVVVLSSGPSDAVYQSNDPTSLLGYPKGDIKRSWLAGTEDPRKAHTRSGEAGMGVLRGINSLFLGDVSAKKSFLDASRYVPVVNSIFLDKQSNCCNGHVKAFP